MVMRKIRPATGAVLALMLEDAELDQRPFRSAGSTVVPAETAPPAPPPPPWAENAAVEVDEAELASEPKPPARGPADPEA
jgi:hypothetical protein